MTEVSRRVALCTQRHLQRRSCYTLRCPRTYPLITAAHSHNSAQITTQICYLWNNAIRVVTSVVPSALLYYAPSPCPLLQSHARVPRPSPRRYSYGYLRAHQHQPRPVALALARAAHRPRYPHAYSPLARRRSPPSTSRYCCRCYRISAGVGVRVVRAASSDRFPPTALLCRKVAVAVVLQARFGVLTEACFPPRCTPAETAKRSNGGGGRSIVH